MAKENEPDDGDAYRIVAVPRVKQKGTMLVRVLDTPFNTNEDARQEMALRLQHYPDYMLVVLVRSHALRFARAENKGVEEHENTDRPS